jgi:TolA-binding protein
VEALVARKRPLIPLLRTSPRDVTDRLYEHRVLLGLATVAILMVILGWWGYRTWHARQENAAQLLLAQAFEAAATTKGEETPEQQGSTAGEKALQLLRQAREEYPWTGAAEQALVQIGNVHYQRGEHQEAVEAYQAYLEQYPSGAWVLLAGLGKGYALEALGRYEDAAATFRAFADRYKGHSLRAEALMGLARSLSQLDRRSEVLEVYGRVIEEYPGTRWAQHAERQLVSSGR